MPPSGDIHDVSMILGELRGAADEIRRMLREMREDHAAMGDKIDAVHDDVVVLKQDMEYVKPQVKASTDFRLRALGALAGMSMLAGALGGYVPAAIKKLFA